MLGNFFVKFFLITGGLWKPTICKSLLTLFDASLTAPTGKPAISILSLQHGCSVLQSMVIIGKLG